MDDNAYKILSYVGVGEIRFGMSSIQVREIIQGSHKVSNKYTDTGVPIDCFPDAGFCIHYRKPGVVEAIEIEPPGKSFFHEKNLLLLSFKESLDLFLKKEPNLEIDGSGFTSQKFGIGIYAPNTFDLPNQLITGVFVFEKGYYEQVFKPLHN